MEDKSEKAEAAKEGWFAETAWDALPALLGLANAGFVVLLVWTFPILNWPTYLVMAALYTIAIAWNIHSVSHNLIHNPFFTSERFNRVYSILVSLTLGFPQTVIRHIHLRHHIGNMDRPNAEGETRDPISIYRHGRDGQPESVWSYSLMSIIRTNPFRLCTSITGTNPDEGLWAKMEIIVLALSLVAVTSWDWRAVPALLPFWFLGHSLSAMTGYYEHFGADPGRPLAWGVSNYGLFYNRLWLNNGYHAEHHFRTKVHWTRMKDLHQQIAERQRAAGTKVLVWPHPLGFLG